MKRQTDIPRWFLIRNFTSHEGAGLCVLHTHTSVSCRKLTVTFERDGCRNIRFIRTDTLSGPKVVPHHHRANSYLHQGAYVITVNILAECGIFLSLIFISRSSERLLGIELIDVSRCFHRTTLVTPVSLLLRV